MQPGVVRMKLVIRCPVKAPDQQCFISKVSKGCDFHPDDRLLAQQLVRRNRRQPFEWKEIRQLPRRQLGNVGAGFVCSGGTVTPWTRIVVRFG